MAVGIQTRLKGGTHHGMPLPSHGMNAASCLHFVLQWVPLTSAFRFVLTPRPVQTKLGIPLPYTDNENATADLHITLQWVWLR